MAFAVASRRAQLAGLLKKLLLADASSLGPASVAAGRRLFNTPVAPTRGDALVAPPHDDDNEVTRGDKSISDPKLFSAAAEAHGWWVSKEDDDTLQLKLEMPGLAAEHVKMWPCQNGLLIKGEGVKDSDDDKEPACYSCRIQLSADAFQLDQTKSEMKYGVLKVTVPKVKFDPDSTKMLKVLNADAM